MVPEDPDLSGCLRILGTYSTVACVVYVVERE